MSRLSSKLPPLNPLVLAGVLLLLTGIVMLGFNLGLGTAAEDRASLAMRTLSGAIQVAQNAILAGDRALTDTQIRFNSVVMAVFVDGLSPSQRRVVESIAGGVRGVARALFSPLGVLTVVALVAAYLPGARALDVRLAAGEPAAPSPEQGEVGDPDDQ